MRYSDCHPNRKHMANGLCKPCYNTKRRKANHAAYNEYSKKYQRNNPTKVKLAQIKYYYGLDSESYYRLVAVFESKCGICRDDLVPLTYNTHLDHCHTTDKIRGILCRACNIMLANIERMGIKGVEARVEAYLAVMS